MKLKRIISVVLVIVMSATLFVFAPATAGATPATASASLVQDTSEVVFLKAGGTGSGATAATALSTLKAAYSALGAGGGTIVVCGDFIYSSTAEGAVYPPEHTGVVTYTSKYNGIDYAASNGAKLRLSTFLYLNGATIFKDIVITQNVSAQKAIVCNANPVLFGTGITCLPYNTSYPGIVGGNLYTYYNRGENVKTAAEMISADITINSGSWSLVRCGRRGNGVAVTYDVSAVVNGGSFFNSFILSGDQQTNGDVNVVINGGIFNNGIYVVAPSSGSSYPIAYSGNLRAKINGGIVKGKIAPASDTTTATYNPTFNGTYTLDLGNADFSAVSAIVGTEAYPGDSISYINNTEMSDATYQNAEILDSNLLRASADPWLFYYDGYYYLISTGSTKGAVRKASTLNGLKTAPFTYLFEPQQTPITMYSKNIWSPEIHYFSADDFGDEYAGWYMFVACDNGENVNHRMYVLKSLDGTPDGQYGHPVTGVANVPILVDGANDATINEEWACGQTLLRYDGKCYAMWVGESGRQTAEFQQYIYIAEMSNPWTFVGQKKSICEPTLNWEMNGYTYSTDTGKWYPKVVEGATPIYAEDGNVYLTYSGSGYWTTYYSLGQLKLVSNSSGIKDPTDINCWEKKATPILTRADTLNAYTLNGSGHASFTVTPGGTKLICYHAYVGTDTSSGRSAYVDTYEVTDEGVVIGDGSTHPSNHSLTVDSSRLAVEVVSGFDYVNCTFSYPSGVGASDVAEIWVDGATNSLTAATATGFSTPVPTNSSVSSVQLLCTDGSTYLYTATRKGENAAFNEARVPEGDNLLTPGGVAIRTSGNQGIRFKSRISESAITNGIGNAVVDEVGTLMKATENDTPLVYVESAFDSAYHIGKGITYNETEDIDICFSRKDGVRTFTSVLTNIPEDNYLTQFDMRPYCSVHDDSGSYIIYGEICRNAIRPVAKAVVAEGGLLDGEQLAYLNGIINSVTVVTWEEGCSYISTGYGGAYPRMATLSDGTLCAVYRSGAYINFRKSTDAGATFGPLLHITPSVYADTNNASNEGFDVTNPEIIALEDDTLLCSFRVNKDCGSDGYYASIRVYESTDKGATWHFHSTVIENTATDGGLWEPYFKMIDHDANPATPDRLAIYYCNDMQSIESKPYSFLPDESLISAGEDISSVYPTFTPVSSGLYQDVVVQLWNENTGKWDAPTVASDGEAHNSRDGMMVITELNDGSYAMTIESSCYRNGTTLAPDGLYHRLVVRMLFSDDGINWTYPVNVFVPTGYAPDGIATSYAGAPYVVTLPDGRIAVSFHSNVSYNPDYIVRTDGQGGQRYNCTMHVIFSNVKITKANRATISTASFSEAFEPIPILENGYSIWCGMTVYKNEYLLAFSGTGINTSSTEAATRRLTVRRASLID